jgi:hypothetical protein
VLEVPKSPVADEASEGQQLEQVLHTVFQTEPTQHEAQLQHGKEISLGMDTMIKT